MKIITGLLVALAVVACSSEKQTEPEKLDGAIPQAQLQALEKAKSVEQTLLDAEAERRVNVDEKAPD